MLKKIKIRRFWLTHYCFAPQTPRPTRAPSLDPAGGLVPSPRFVPLRNNFLATPLITTTIITKLASIIMNIRERNYIIKQWWSKLDQ